MLNGKQRRYLRSIGHRLVPVVWVGKEGVSEPLVEAAGTALETHELIKVKIGEGAGDRHEIAEALATACKAELAGVLGRTALVYKRRKKDPQIRLPRA
jgi:RNA-binding protein